MPKRPKKSKFIWPFFKRRKAEEVEKKPKITNLTSQKPN